MSTERGPWLVRPWGKSWMVMRPGPIGLAHYIRSPSGKVKFFRSTGSAQEAADKANGATGQADQGSDTK